MMVTSLRVLSGCLVFAGLVVGTAAFGQGASPENRYVVSVNEGADPAQVAAAHGVAARHIYRHALNGFAAEVPPGRLAALANDPRVAHIAVDHPVMAFAGKPVKPSPNPGEVVPAGVRRVGAEEAWVDGITGKGVGVAILDTGLDFNHADLAVNISESSYVSPGFTYTTSAQDDAGHGTHVGGIVAAADNMSDVVGVAPNATLYAVKVLDRTGSGYDSDIIGGLNWVLANAKTLDPQIKVINMSLGRGASSDDSAMHTAIQSVVAAGVTVVVAAGNDASADVSQMVPAGFTEVIAVASTTAVDGTSNVKTKILADTASYFTTDGAGVAISAPGEEAENIKYPRISSVGVLSLALGGGTVRMSGTSMAAPHAAGVVALLLQKYPTLTPDTVKTQIQADGDRAGVAPLNSPTGGYSFDGEREGIIYAPMLLGP